MKGVFVEIKSNELCKKELKEMDRLKFVLDRANRYPDLLDINETKKLSLRLDALERKFRVRA